jgi:hypothetical protein
MESHRQFGQGPPVTTDKLLGLKPPKISRAADDSEAPRQKEKISDDLHFAGARPESRRAPD